MDGNWHQSQIWDILVPMTTTVDPATSQPAQTLPDHRAAELRRRELAAFLRNRRERLTPEQLGLPEHGRRRTPGLRREEVAQHASRDAGV